MDKFTAVWARAVACEVCWVRDREPYALAAVPLLDGEIPCVAFPYHNASLVAGLTNGTSVGFAVTDPRSLRGSAGDSPAAPDPIGIAVTGDVERIDDVTGQWFVERLLPEELAKHPPSRALAESRLLRRENWWWLPRIVVRMTRVTTRLALPARTEPDVRALLVSAIDDRPEMSVVEPADPTGWSTGSPLLRPVAISPGGGPSPGERTPALVFGHDYAVPDLERWESWWIRGRLVDDRLEESGRAGDAEPDLGPLGIRERMRRHRDLQRTCRAGIEDAERAGKPAGRGPRASGA